MQALAQQGHAPSLSLAGKWASIGGGQPCNSADSVQTAGDQSASHQQHTQLRALLSCGSGGHAMLPPGLDGSSAAEADDSPMMMMIDAVCAKAAIREALVPLSPAELAAVQEQLRQSRLARQFSGGCSSGSAGAGGSTTTTTTTSGVAAPAPLQAPSSCSPQLSCASSGPDDSSSTGAFGGGVVAQVAAALAKGVVAQEDVARVLSQLDPAVLQPPQHAAPGTLPVPPLHFTPTALGTAAPPVVLPGFLHPQYSAPHHQARPLGSLASPVSCVASAPGSLAGAGRCFSAVSSLALPPAALPAATATSSRHPGAAPTKAPRSSGSQRRPRSTVWLPGLLPVRRRRRPAAAAALDMQQQPQHEASAPLELPHVSGVAAPGTSLAARFARLPAGVQAQLLLELEALAAGEDELRAARGGGARGSADPYGLRRSGRARRARDWGSGGFSTTGGAAGSRSASPDPERPGAAANADAHHAPKRARLDTSGSAQPPPHHGAASPMLAGTWGDGAAAWGAPPAFESLSLALEQHQHRQESPPPAPRRRRIVRRPGARAAARKAMRRRSFARGKPQRAPAV